MKKNEISQDLDDDDYVRKSPSETVAAWRSRMRSRGFVQVTVWVPRAERPALKSLAAALSNGKGSELRDDGNSGPDLVIERLTELQELLKGAPLDRLTKLPEMTDNARVATDADIAGLRQALPAAADNEAIAAAVVEALKERLAEKARLIELLEKIAAEPRNTRSFLWGLFKTSS